MPDQEGYMTMGDLRKLVAESPLPDDALVGIWHDDVQFYFRRTKIGNWETIYNDGSMYFIDPPSPGDEMEGNDSAGKEERHNWRIAPIDPPSLLFTGEKED